MVSSNKTPQRFSSGSSFGLRTSESLTFFGIACLDSVAVITLGVRVRVRLGRSLAEKHQLGKLSGPHSVKQKNQQTVVCPSLWPATSWTGARMS